MELKDLKKAFHKAVNEVFDAIEVAQEVAVAQRASALQTAMQEKLDKALGGAGKAKVGLRGAKPGIQPCKLTGKPSGGPRYNFLAKDVHAKLYQGRTAAEGAAVVTAILDARAKGERHPEDTFEPQAAAPEPTVEAAPEAATEPDPQERIATVRPESQEQASV